MKRFYYGTKCVLGWREEKDGKPGYGVQYSDGYTSWSPREAFESAYQPMGALSFGHAVEVLKDGKRVARAGWNGKGMWLRYMDPYSDKEFSVRENGNVLGYDSGTLMPYIGMHTADNKFVPWLASQTDILANDWMVL